MCPLKILFSLLPFAIIIKFFLHSMENTGSSIRKWNISTTTTIIKSSETLDGWPSSMCGVCVCYYVMNEVYMNFSLFLASFFFTRKVFKCIYRFKWTNWTMFIHINHNFSRHSMCCMLFAVFYIMHMCNLYISEIKLLFQPTCLPMSVK